MACDRDDAVLSVRPAGYAGKAAEPVPGCCRADRRELQVDGGIPALAVQGRAVDQVQEVRAEGKRRGHRQYRQHSAGQGGAYRHGGAPAARLDRKPDAYCCGYRRADGRRPRSRP